MDAQTLGAGEDALGCQRDELPYLQGTQQQQAGRKRAESLLFLFFPPFFFCFLFFVFFSAS